MKAKSVKGDNAAEFISACKKAISQDFSPTLAVFFASFSLDWDAVLAFFEEQNIQIFGMTSAGEICNEEVSELSAVAMLLEAKPEHFALFGENKLADESFFDFGKRMANEALQKFDAPALVIHSGGLLNDGEAIVRGILSVKDDMPIFGGLAGDNFRMQQTWAQVGRKQISSGIAVLAWDTTKVNCLGVASSGWKTVGIERVITKSVGNIVYEIDGQDALEVITRYFKLPENMSPSDVVMLVGSQYPLHVFREDGTSVIRACLMSHPEGGLVFAGSVPQGAKVKFSVPPDLDIIETSVDEVKQIKPKIENADAIFIYSCKARHLSLGPMIDRENCGIMEIWDKPLVGLFTYGEIGAKHGTKCDFHNETISVLVIAEK
jgi:hypothetical protein